ncbi:MAG: phosphoadenosine phosphosulfate reductase family protein [Pseudomonadales bacterium]
MENLDLAAINEQLREASPAEIVRWALDLQKKTIVTTSFSPNSAVMLHLAATLDRRMPVIWVDSGYNTRDTYLVAERLISDLQLNMHIYAPEMTSARRDALMGIPAADDEVLHKEFSRQVKLDPFAKAIAEHLPEIWLSGIRMEETAFRKTLDILSWDSRGILKVAPLFHWSESQVEDYMEQFDLPTCRRYFDPTKVADNVECGLHTGA